MNRKSAIQLSVTAIVILILAIVMLGLGLGFIRGMFGKVSTQVEQQISTEAEPPIPTGANPLTLSREKIITSPKEVAVLKIGVYNPTNRNWVSEASSEDLIGYWDFDNIDGDILKDLSGNGNDGTVYGATLAEGRYGAALSFDGGGDYVEVEGDSSLDLTDSDLTISAWVQEDATSSYAKILSRRNGSKFYFLGSDNGSIYGGIGNGTEFTVTSKTQTIEVGWHHVVFVFDDTNDNGKIYYDGNIVDDDTINHSIPSWSGEKLIIGTDDHLGLRYHFNGLIDEVLIFNKALTEEEIQDLYDIGVAPRVICESSLMSGLMSSVNQRIIDQGESTNFNYLIRLPGNVPEGEYLCKVVLMDYEKDLVIEVKT